MSSMYSVPQQAQRPSPSQVVQSLEVIKVEYEAMARDIEQYRRVVEEQKMRIEGQVNEATQMQANYRVLQEQVAELRKHYEMTISTLKDENKRLTEQIARYGTTPAIGAFSSPVVTVAAAAAASSVSSEAPAAAPATLAVVPGLVDEIQKDGWTFGYASAEQAAAPDKLSIDLSATFVHNDAVCDAVFSPDGTYLATSSFISVNIFEWKSQRLVHTFAVKTSPDTKNYVRCVKFSPDGKMIAAGADDGYIRLWNLEDKSLVQEWNAHSSSLVSVSFTPDGKKLISSGQDATVVLWDINTLKKLLTICETPNTPSTGTVPALSPDGSLLAVSWPDGYVRLYRLDSPKSIASYSGPQEKIFALSFSPDGKTVAAASLDSSVTLFDVTNYESEPKTINMGHTNLALSVAFSPDGRWIVSGSKDKTVRISRANPVVLAGVLCGHTNTVLKVSFAPVTSKSDKEDETEMKDVEDEGMYMVTGSGDQTVRVWRLSQAKAKAGEGETKQDDKTKAKTEETA